MLVSLRQPPHFPGVQVKPFALDFNLYWRLKKQCGFHPLTGAEGNTHLLLNRRLAHITGHIGICVSFTSHLCNLQSFVCTVGIEGSVSKVVSAEDQKTYLE